MKVCKVLPIIAVVLSIGCGGDSESPSPTAASQRVAQVGGLWTYSSTLGVRCPDGSVRNVRLTTGGVNATVNGGTAIGTEADTYNVTTTSGAPIAAMTRNSTFGASKR